ncbi:MAG: hypothetical protein ACM3VT_02490 [Solirubrobacterales bacterium]
MKSRLPWGRVVAVSAGTLLFAFGARCLFVWRTESSEFRRDIQFACPFAIGMDFSSVGQYSVSFTRGPVGYVKESFLGLDVPEAALSGTSPDKLLAGLDAAYTIFDSEEKKVHSSSLAGQLGRVSSSAFPSILHLSDDLAWLPEGRYRIEVSVAAGAPALRNVPQRFVLAIDDGAIHMRRTAIRGLARVGEGSIAIATAILAIAAIYPIRVSSPITLHDAAR